MARAPAYPVAINLFGSHAAHGAGARRRRPRRRSATASPQLLDLKVPDGLLAKLGAAAAPARDRASSRRARASGTPACQEIVWQGDEIDLDKLPDHHLLARGRRSVRHADHGDLQGPGARHSQRGDVPRAAAGQARRGHALAAPQDRAPSTCARDGRARGEDAGVHRRRRRSGRACTAPRRRCRPWWTSSSLPASCAARR